ncbi:hypothetical protein GALMADRAFT_225694 [Galerina marginata CBS 339.88]|uniref:Uncharacterized protein n=1 Tax=Galerina marginata (strain CBS 339.88) TaxID=685588 RepID=A0A067T3B3_GALM3|nr:hypothetical protein GALMADRAFT_225694 [Galerina marginata CBS 339.88]
MSKEEFRTILPLFKDLRSSISKTMKLFIAKKTAVRKVAVNPTQGIYPVSQTKDHLVSLLHHLSGFEKELDHTLPFDQDLTSAFGTMKTEIDFQIALAISAYRKD